MTKLSSQSHTRRKANVSLMGGEMLTWSDGAQAPAALPVLVELLHRTLSAGGRVLVAGPHPGDLIDLVVDRSAQVVCLLRSFPDAQTLGDRYADVPGFSVHCGAPEKYVPEEPFDAVIALGGLLSLPSSDGADLCWEEEFAHLSTMLAPGGSLLLAVENELGIQRLSGATKPDDFDWRPLSDHSRPARSGRLVRRLEQAGLTLDRAYGAYPLLGSVAVLMAADLFDDPAVDVDVPAAVIAAECSRAFAGRSVLTDPRQLAERAVRSGLGGELAPAWIVIAHQGAAAPRPLPDGLVADGVPKAGWSIAYELSADAAGGWTRRMCHPERAAQPVTLGRVIREPERLITPVPVGRVLDGVLLDACAREDVLRLRETLRAFARWLTGQVAAGRPAGELLFATTDNVIVNGDDFALLDPSWRLAEEVPVDLLLCRILRGFATRLLIGGHRHAWPPGTEADTLTATLCAMAGHPVSRVLPAQVVWLEAEITAAQQGLSRMEEQRLAQELTDIGTASYNPRSHRDALEANGRLQEELHAAKLKIEWLEKLLNMTDRRLRNTRNLLKSRDRHLRNLNKSPGLRIVRVLLAPTRLVRGVLRHMIPPPVVTQSRHCPVCSKDRP